MNDTLRLLGLDTGGVIYRDGHELVLPGLKPSSTISEFQWQTIYHECGHGVSLFSDCAQCPCPHEYFDAKDCQRCTPNGSCQNCGHAGAHDCPSDVCRGECDGTPLVCEWCGAQAESLVEIEDPGDPSVGYGPQTEEMCAECAETARNRR